MLLKYKDYIGGKWLAKVSQICKGEAISLIRCNCYVLFVKTSYKERVVDKLKTRLDSLLFLLFAPTKEKFFRRNGITIKEKELCFIRCVFVESELYLDEFTVKISPIVRLINDICKIIDYGNKRDIAIWEDEWIYVKKLIWKQALCLNLCRFHGRRCN